MQAIMVRIKESKRIIIGAIGFICFYIYELYSRNKCEISIFEDHFGLMASAAKLAGYNWGEVLKLSGYYGPGFFVIFTPLLKYGSNPIVIYNAIVDVCLFVEALAMVLLYGLLNKYINRGDYYVNILVSSIVSFVVLHSEVVSSFGNEQYIVLISIILAFLICNIINSESKIQIIMYSVIYTVILAYSILVHIRNIVFLVGTIAVFLFVVIKRGKCGKRIKILSVFLALDLALCAFIYKYGPIVFSKLLFSSWDDTTQKANISIHIIQSPFLELVQGAIYVLVGNIYESIIHTYGIMLFGYYCVGKIMTSFIKKNIIRNDNEKIEYIDLRIILFVFSASMYFCGLIGLALSAHGTPRMVGYWRYYGSYSALMMAIAIIYSLNININTRIKAMAIIICMICFKAIMKIKWWITGKYLFFWFIYQNLKGNEEEIGLLITFIIACVGILILFSNSKRKICYYCIFFSFTYIFLNIGNGGLAAYTVNNRCDSGYQLIKKLSDDDIINCDEDIYFIGSDESYMYYQFMCLKNGVKRNLPINNRDGIIVFSDCSNISVLSPDDGWMVIQMDDNEYIYSKNESLIEYTINYINKNK